MADYIKFYRGGKVAVLYSPGFGAGWSTWSYGERAEQLAFDARLVQAALNGVNDIQPLLDEIFGPSAHTYPGGWGTIKIKWLPVGTRFTIKEYDGAEFVKLLGSLPIFIA